MQPYLQLPLVPHTPITGEENGATMTGLDHYDFSSGAWKKKGEKMHFINQLLDSSVGKESTCNVGDLGSIPGLGRSPGEGKDYPLQYSGLENSMDYSPWGRKELDTTEQLSLSLSLSRKHVPASSLPVVLSTISPHIHLL